MGKTAPSILVRDTHRREYQRDMRRILAGRGLKNRAVKLVLRPRRLFATTLGCCLALLAIGCGETELGAGTSCRDFLQASTDEQNAAVARVADELGTAAVVDPLSRIAIDTFCATDQDRTLGEAVESTG